MRNVLRTIDSISEWTGKTACWLVAILVAVMTYEVIMRYVFTAPTMWAYETSVMLGATVYVLAWSYDHLHHSHVRVDIFYMRLSPRGKAAIDVIGTLLLFFPLIIILVDSSIANALQAWSTNERLKQTFWYPPAGPLRTLIAVGFILFALQAIAQFVRDSYSLVKGKPCD